MLLKLTGEISLLLVESNLEKWRKHLTKESGKWDIRVTCDRGICVAMSDALLVCKKIDKMLKSWGLILNPCNPCVWNKIVNQKQLAVIFHMDDLMMAHLRSSTVVEGIKLLDEVCGSQDLLTVVRGKIYECAGVTIEFSLKVGAALHQNYFIKKIWNDMPMELKAKCRREPAREDLFKVDLNSESLDHNKKNAYHHATENSLLSS